MKLTEAKTAGGKTIGISTDGGVKVGTATGKVNVTKTDIKASNGVIHVIDAVILPYPETRAGSFPRVTTPRRISLLRGVRVFRRDPGPDCTPAGGPAGPADGKTTIPSGDDLTDRRAMIDR